MSAEGTETVPDAPGETETGATQVESTEATPEVQRPAPRLVTGPPQKDQRSKFLVVYAVLGAVLAFAAVGLVALLMRPDSGPGEAWSSWRPAADDPVARAQEIANEVGATYRLASGAQLAYVQAEEQRWARIVQQNGIKPD